MMHKELEDDDSYEPMRKEDTTPNFEQIKEDECRELRKVKEEKVIKHFNND